MNFKKCKGCEDRKVNCHSTCVDYLDYRRKRMKVYEDRRINIDAGVGSSAYFFANDRRCERR